MSKVISFKDYNPNRDDKYYFYLKNFDIAEKHHKKSHFNLNTKKLKIQFPTKNDKYAIREVYYLAKFDKPIIFIHISDNTTTATRDLDKNFIADINYPFSEIKSCSNDDLDLSNEKEVVIFIYNDNDDLSCYSVLLTVINNILNDNKLMSFSLTRKSAFQPKEGNDGGGVIIEGP